MKAICKKYYPYNEGDYLNSVGGMIMFQTFLTGKTYEIVNKVFNNSEYWYNIKNERGTTEIFDETDFNDYFTTVGKIRKEKLQKINKLNYE